MPRKAMPATSSSAASALDHLNLVAKLADLKEDHYRTLLTLSAVTELLIDKGLISPEELERRINTLDSELDELIDASLHPMP
ncbi:nitrile hydratase subunit alpha [Paenibacillus sp. OV219]|uniref:nitrile hydratase subunit alpha n=1 Tax=Paenibacillus sp. OV219 TaxID=1884377 RepID=UPI0008C14E46|nr:nitrile hydratase subunit alpha [Paenibacillus sp. OV219]SEN48626.1 hypothetical protein SAMN05518847_10347 [Paenibacillus sp. OV219]